MIDFDSWDAGGSSCYLYTENWDFAKALKKEFGRCAVYLRNTRAVAWQYRVPKRVILRLKRRGLTEYKKAA